MWLIPYFCKYFIFYQAKENEARDGEREVEDDRDVGGKGEEKGW